MLVTSTPAQEGVDASGLLAFVDAVTPHPHSLMILRHGRVIAQGWWAPYTRDRASELYSLSKSFVSTAAAFAVQEGLLDLDAPLASYFPEYGHAGEPVLVRHALAMASGHTEETWGRALEAAPDDPVRGFLNLPPDREPGTVFAYNQPNTYTVAAIIQRVTGQGLVDYLRPRLFDPLGIAEASWTRMGRDLGFVGLHTTTDAIASLGQLYLDGGVWEGRQLLPRAWVDEATRRQIATDPDEASDWGMGYGYQFWMSRHGYRGDGAFGQFCLVLPEQDAVVAITGATEDMQGVLDLVWKHVLPAFEGPGDPAADVELARRLGSVSLAGPYGGAEPDDAAGWDGATFTGGDLPFPEVTVRRSGGGWVVALPGVEVPVGTGRWETRGTVAVAGGWQGDTLAFDLVFLRTPHRLSVTCALAGGLAATWNCVPLGDASWERLVG